MIPRLSRLPPLRLLLVLVPGLVLAVLGARAVSGEMQAEETRARGRAREAAERLARSVRSLVSEYAQSLPTDGGTSDAVTAADALTATRALFPRFVFDSTLASADPADVALYEPSEAGLAYVGDALDAAEALGDDAAGDEAAALLLRGLASAAPSPAATMSLRLAAAAHESQLWSLLPPESVSRYEEVARNAPGLPDADRQRLLLLCEDSFGALLPDLAVQERARWDQLRDLARDAQTRSGLSMSILPRDGSVSIAVAVRSGQFVLGGEIPSSAVADRIGIESAALATAAGFRSVHLVAATGERAFGSTTPINGSDVLLEAASLADAFSGTSHGALDGWRAEAMVTRPRGVPQSALLLAAAVALAAIALSIGAMLLHRAAVRQAALARERQSFLDHVAHEVRTPSAALLALGEELAAGHVPEERRTLYVGHIVTEARRLARLVDDTLDLSRLDAGRLVFQRSPCDLRVVAERGVLAAAAGTRARVVADQEPVVADADPAALARVVRNLVDNAIRHGGGDSGVVTVSVRRDGGNRLIVVADQGPGIDDAVRARLFERFHRSTTTTHETKGIGIGLSLCREIVAAHGGRIDVVSHREGRKRGTTFTVTLPAHTGPAREPSRGAK